MLTRRKLGLGAGALALAACSQTQSKANAAEAKMTEGKMSDPKIDWANLSEREWQDQLTAEEFRVLRKEGTERPFSSELNENKKTGTYVCAGCALPLFTSDKKFDSGTGWPSFFQPIDGALGTKVDRKLLVARTEYHCGRCGGHQGHVFKDGPRPTGLRYCNNGVALDFIEG
jgi:peptide-methionine (R)-S-oxide reductase